MKKNVIFLPLIALCTLVFFACKKDVTPVKPPPPPPPAKSILQLLTENTWIYNKYFTHYNSDTTNQVYQKGAASNTLDLSLDQVTFHTDLTYVETDNVGNVLNGTYDFLSDSTMVQVVNITGTYVSTIKKLNDTAYNWLSTSASNGTYAEMIAK